MSLYRLTVRSLWNPDHFPRFLIDKDTALMHTPKSGDRTRKVVRHPHPGPLPEGEGMTPTLFSDNRSLRVEGELFEAGGLVEAAHDVHVLDSASGCALDQVVQAGDGHESVGPEVYRGIDDAIVVA